MDTRGGRWFFFAFLLALIAYFAWSILRAITYEGPPTVGRSERDIAYFGVVGIPLFVLVALERLRVLRGGDPDEPGAAGRMLRNRTFSAALGVLFAASLVLTVLNPLGI